MNNLNFLSTELQALFKKYIELDTSLLSGENYPEVINLFDNYLTGIGFQTEQIQIPESVIHKPNRVHLVARRFQNSQLPTLLVYSHIDVVPALYEDAFKFRVGDGRVFGRGTADHKGSTTALLGAFEKLKDVSLKYNIVFWATTDEETDQLEQLRYVANKLNLPNNTIIFDPDTFAGGVTVGNLGLLQLEVKVLGKSAHSGMSNLGVNAIEQTSLLIHSFFKLIKTEYESAVSKIVPFPSVGLSSMCSRCNVNMIHGGIASNVVPDVCMMTIDCRYIPEANVEDEKNVLIKRLEDFCHKNSIEYEAAVKQLLHGHAEDHPEAKRLDVIYEQVSGESGLYGAMGSTPLAHWAVEQNLPHIGLGVIRADSNIHGVNESAAIKDINNLSETFKLFIQS